MNTERDGEERIAAEEELTEAVKRDEANRQFAVEARDCNVLLSAAAGSGKTTVLVNRIAGRLLRDDPAPDLDEFLLVTFTEKAAAELRQRLDMQLARSFQDALAAGEQEKAERAYRQRMLLPKARIGTIDSFCLEVVRKNFLNAGIDPALRIDNQAVESIRNEVADRVLEACYADRESVHYPVLRELVDLFCQMYSDDGLKKELLFPVLQFADNFPNPHEWLARMEENYETDATEPEENIWYRALLSEMRAVCGEIAAHIEQVTEAARCGTNGFGVLPDPEKYLVLLESERDYYAELAACFSRPGGALPDPGLLYKDAARFPSSKKSYSEDEKLAHVALQQTRKAWNEFFKRKREAVFGKKESYSPEKWKRNLAGGLSAAGRYVHTLRFIADEILSGVNAEMQRRRVYSFSRIEHLALEILCEGTPENREDGPLCPSAAARAYGAVLKEIYIDEYQDTSLLQEKILQLVSGLPYGRQNLFMVGDVKQSIYRFRQAKPRLFTEKYKLYKEHPERGQVRVLGRNFRSRKKILDAVNSVFAVGMTETVSGLSYRDGEMLRYGAKELYDANPQTDAQDGRAEFCLCAADPIPAVIPYKEENLLVIDKILGLFENGFRVYERDAGMRPVRFSDIAVLTRTNQDVTDIAKTLAAFGLPAETAADESFFDRLEVQTALDFLRVIDNPYQDIPLAAVLRSPYYGLSDNELALIRVCTERDRLRGFYGAVCRIAEAEQAPPSGAENLPGSGNDPDCDLPTEEKLALPPALREKLVAFCGDLRLFRSISRAESVSRLVWLAVNHRGFYERADETEKGNLRLLLEKSYGFDGGENAGLFGFLAHMDFLISREASGAFSSGQKEAAYVSPKNAPDKIKIMTVHKSKGLEFPVVFLVGAGKSMKGREKPVYLDETLGIGLPSIFGENGNGLRQTDPSAAVKALKEKEMREEFAESQRLLYVAMTRAREKLFVTATYPGNGEWRIDSGLAGITVPVSDFAIRSANSFRDMIFLSVFSREAASSWVVEKYASLHERLLGGAAEKRVAALFERRAEENAGPEQEERERETPGGMEACPEADAAARQEEERAEQTRSRLLALLDDGSVPAKLTVSAVKKLATASPEEGLRVEGKLPALGKMPEEEPPKTAHGFSPSEFGTLMHKCMRLLLKDRASWPEEKETEAYTEEFLRRQRDRGALTEEEFAAADRAMLGRFLLSPRAPEIRQAAALRSEIPFTVLTDAERYLDPDRTGKFYVNGEKKAETSLALQGVIDLYYIKDGEIVLVDFKTDRVQPEDASPPAALEQYAVQLACYKDALEKITGLRVAEAVLYFLRTGKEYIYDKNFGG